MAKKSAKELVPETGSVLESRWRAISEQASRGELADVLEEADLVAAVRRSIRSQTESYRYVLPTQLIAKLADPTLDARSLQAKGGGAGA